MSMHTPLVMLCAPMLVTVGSAAGLSEAEVPFELKAEASKMLGREPTPAESEFLYMSAQGLPATLPAGKAKAEAIKNEDEAKVWREDRTIDARLIAWLCTSPKASALVTHKGLSIRGARIVHELDLTDAKVSFPISFIRCYMPDEINFSNADLQSFSLEESIVGTINGRSSRVKGDVRLNKLLRAWKVDLSNAALGGDLDCSGSLFSNDGTDAKEVIYADYITVGRNIVMNDGFRAEKQVRITGAIVDGDVHCIGGTFSNPGGVALNASGMTVKGNAYFQSNGKQGAEASTVKIFGTFELSNARIAGDLHCSGGQFLYVAAANPIAIRAHGLNVTGDVHLDGGFRSEGPVDLTATQVGGSLQLSGGTFKAEKDIALDLRLATVGHDVVMGPGFSSSGDVRLDGASIGWNLDCCGGRFSNPHMIAISASGASIKGDIHLKDDDHLEPTKAPDQRNFVADGEIRLDGATIGGNLDCTGGRFANPGLVAIEASGMTIKGHTLLKADSNIDHKRNAQDKLFSADGEVKFRNARIGGDLNFNGGRFFHGIDASAAVIDGHVHLSEWFKSDDKVTFTFAKVGRSLIVKDCFINDDMMLDLQSAEAGTLAHNPATGKATLAINGFTYGQIDPDSLTSVETMKRWLELQAKDKYSGSCNVQLASVLAKTGQASDANEILIHKEKKEWQQDATKEWKKLPKDHLSWAKFNLLNKWVWNWLWYNVLGWVINYGFDPLRAIWVGLVVVLIGWLVFYRARKRKFLVEKEVHEPERKFSALVYSIDLFTPIVNFYERENWIFFGERGARFNLRLFLFRIYWMVHIALGWIITSLIVAGLLGIVRH
jgi:hypothetical protein